MKCSDILPFKYMGWERNKVIDINIPLIKIIGTKPHAIDQFYFSKIFQQRKQNMKLPNQETWKLRGWTIVDKSPHDSSRTCTHPLFSCYLKANVLHSKIALLHQMHQSTGYFTTMGRLGFWSMLNNTVLLSKSCFKTKL